jgi:hypothetical protein
MTAAAASRATAVQRVMACVITMTILARKQLSVSPPVPGRETARAPTAVPTNYLADTISRKTFLVDTGAAVSVFPHSGPAHKADSYLTGPDNKPIRSWGNKVISVCFGGHTLACEFVLAAISRPILGIDFLARHKLLVDAAARRVLFAASLLPLAATAATAALAAIYRSSPLCLPSAARSDHCWPPILPLLATASLAPSHTMVWSM